MYLLILNLVSIVTNVMILDPLNCKSQKILSYAFFQFFELTIRFLFVSNQKHY